MALRALPTKIAPMRSKIEMRKRTEPFYQSSEWKALKAKIKHKRPWRCELCGKTREDDGSAVDLIFDHTIERRDGGPSLDERNVQMLCTRAGGDGADGRGGCHNRKTGLSKAARRQGWGGKIPSPQGAFTG